jgi:hypothetical protein
VHRSNLERRPLRPGVSGRLPKRPSARQRDYHVKPEGNSDPDPDTRLSYAITHSCGHMETLGKPSVADRANPRLSGAFRALRSLAPNSVNHHR